MSPEPTPGPVLVTGAAGFIGSHLSEHLLDEGRQVVGIDNFCDFYDPAAKRRNVSAALRDRGFTLAEADIRDAAAVRSAFASHRPGAVVHLAAMAGVRPSIRDPALYADVNVTGTVNILDAAAAHGVPRVVIASSSSIYGNNEKVPFAEDDPVDRPISPYAATKRACELLGHACCHLHGMAVTCLRLFTVFGPRQRPDLAIARFMRLLGAGEPLPVFGDGETSRDYTYVDDIVAGITATLQRDAGYRIYNLGGDHPVSLNEMIATIERVTGKRARIERQPMQPGDVSRTWADLARSRAELGYQPRTSLAEGMARQWEWGRGQ